MWLQLVFVGAWQTFGRSIIFDLIGVAYELEDLPSFTPNSRIQSKTSKKRTQKASVLQERVKSSWEALQKTLLPPALLANLKSAVVAYRYAFQLLNFSKKSAGRCGKLALRN
jgi:ABC-type transporter Mla maintaining outer membrane lipid asymmetry permease subunit MlaE